MKKLADTLILVSMVLCFIVPCFVVGLNIWGWLFTAMMLLVAAWEVYSYAKDRKTISQKFRAWARLNPKKSWYVLGALTSGWFFLMIHLAV